MDHSSRQLCSLVSSIVALKPIPVCWLGQILKSNCFMKYLNWMFAPWVGEVCFLCKGLTYFILLCIVSKCSSSHCTGFRGPSCFKFILSSSTTHISCVINMQENRIGWVSLVQQRVCHMNIHDTAFRVGSWVWKLRTPETWDLSF